jgi:two-component sensor histidine kinase
MQLSARRAVGQAQLMAKEIDHRVMNSLQFVSGLLRMQSRSPATDGGTAHLELAANRVAAVAQVHRHFARDASDEASCIDFLRRLCSDLSAILDRSIVVAGDVGQVPTTWIQPIGLLVNELVTNAAKHGAGEIDVTYTTTDGRHQLIVRDEGPGLASDFNPDEDRASLGMRIITLLVKQLRGTMTAANRTDAKGACFTITF